MGREVRVWRARAGQIHDPVLRHLALRTQHLEHGNYEGAAAYATLVPSAYRAQVVRAVVELCASLGLVTVAEGVEKAAQAFALETLGVDQVQGYFHGRPTSDVAAMEWLLPRRVASFATSVP